MICAGNWTVSKHPIVCDTTVLLYLGRVGQAVIAYAYAHRSYVAGLDDLQARRLAEAVGLRVVGTLGILLRAKRAGLIATVRPLVDAVTAQGFRLSLELQRDVLELAGEAINRPVPGS
jgi:predicted nucleic acid-binding protein